MLTGTAYVGVQPQSNCTCDCCAPAAGVVTIEELQDSSSVQMCLRGLRIGLFCYMQLTSRSSLQPRNRCARNGSDLVSITTLRVSYTVSIESPYAWFSVGSCGCTIQHGFWASNAPAAAPGRGGEM